MENKLKCHPVMLPTADKTTLLAWYDETRIEIPWDHKSAMFKSQHLYLVSDREIKEGDWCYLMVDKRTVQIKSYLHLQNAKRNGFKKVEATTDPSLGLPLIPQSFIEEWVAKQGKIKEVYIKSDYGCPSLVTRGNIKGVPNWIEVTILPVKDSWSAEEVEKKAVAFTKWMRKKGYSIPNSNPECQDLWSIGHQWPTELKTSSELFQEFDKDY